MTYSLSPIAVGCSGYGAAELATDSYCRVVCKCEHATKEEALACAADKTTPALAKTAFDAYVASTGGKTWDGKDVPPFEIIAVRTPHVARAWEAAVDAVRRKLEVEE